MYLPRAAKRPADGTPAKLAFAAFTLIEIMLVVSIIALMAAIAVPSFLRARKRSQAVTVKNDLRLIDHAIEQYAVETSKPSGAPVFADDWLDYIKESSNLYDSGQDVFGTDYGDQTVDTLPHVPATTWDTLSDAVDANFWSPYQRETTASSAPPPTRHKTKRRRH